MKTIRSTYRRRYPNRDTLYPVTSSVCSRVENFTMLEDLPLFFTPIVLHLILFAPLRTEILTWKKKLKSNFFMNKFINLSCFRKSHFYFRLCVSDR